MEDNRIRRDEPIPYTEGSLPYYEYSSVPRPLNPPLLPPLPPPPPPTRSRNKGLALILGVVSIVLVVLIVFLASLAPALLRQPSPRQTPLTTLPTQTPTFQATPTAQFRSASCPFPLGDGIVEGQNVTCGLVTVPENRSHPDGAQVHLAVAIFKSPNVQHDPSPVIRLEGGPGGPSLENWAQAITGANYSTFVFNHDLIFFDQRGTGYSTPSLACPEILQLQYATLDKQMSATDAERM